MSATVQIFSSVERWNCSIQRGEAELKGIFCLSPNENICSIAQIRKHSLFEQTYLQLSVAYVNDLLHFAYVNVGRVYLLTVELRKLYQWYWNMWRSKLFYSRFSTYLLTSYGLHLILITLIWYKNVNFTLWAMIPSVHICRCPPEGITQILSEYDTII